MAKETTEAMAATATAKPTKENAGGLEFQVEHIGPEFFPNPLQILLGYGDVVICSYSQGDGTHGVMLSQASRRHEIGEIDEEYDPGSHTPQPNEVYIHCTNRESAVVLLDQVQKMVDMFDGK